jgi:hypothetical protein
VLEELDLTRNLLGGAEQLNTVMPELVTAGEAFAELIAIGSEGAEGGISDNRCKLKKLIIPWNMIRGDSAVEFCSQLRYNDSLIHLDIGYNAIGKDGARMIGDSLTVNKTLRYLDLTSNNIDCTGCFCITVGIIEVCVSSLSSSSSSLLLLSEKSTSLCQVSVAQRSRLTLSHDPPPPPPPHHHHHHHHRRILLSSMSCWMATPSALWEQKL